MIRTSPKRTGVWTQVRLSPGARSEGSSSKNSVSYKSVLLVFI